MKLTKTRLKQIIREELLNEENESSWTWIYKGLLSGLNKAGKKGSVDLEDVARGVGYLIKTEWGAGAKNAFIKSFKRNL